MRGPRGAKQRNGGFGSFFGDGGEADLMQNTAQEALIIDRREEFVHVDSFPESIGL